MSIMKGARQPKHAQHRRRVRNRGGVERVPPASFAPCRFFLRSSIVRCPPSTQHEYWSFFPFSIALLDPRPPPSVVRNASRLSQSKFVRQKIIACSILNLSRIALRMCGFRRFTASLLASSESCVGMGAFQNEHRRGQWCLWCLFNLAGGVWRETGARWRLLDMRVDS